ncbi:MAG: efflux RND transporter permease subunit [Alphaproteobacteria bacterium]|nr:efflux RND transporter permease subunit [Alphaproteobacteria bacterium]
MTLTRWAVTRTRVTWMALILIVVAGVLSYNALPKAEDPGYTIRVASVVTVLPGASPRRMEQLVTAPIEEAIQEIPEVVEISSTSSTGLSRIRVEIDESIFDLDPVFTDIRDAVADAQADLPAEAFDPIVTTNVGNYYGVQFALTSEGFPHVEHVQAAEAVKQRLLLVDDASEVDLFGDQERQIVLEFDHARLSRSGLSPEALAGLVQTANIMSPGGQIDVGEEQLSLEPSGAFRDLNDIRELTVPLPSGGLSRLGDLVDVRDTLEDPAAPWAYFNGQRAVIIGASQREGGNSQRFGEQTRAQVRQIQAELPLGLELHELAFEPDAVQDRIDGFVNSLLQSIGIVFLVILAFLGLRTGAIVASMVPTVMCATFMLMSAFDVGIDQMSLAALLLALGMLVDNAIVMSETTTVRVQQGQPILEAVVDAAQELWVPLLISSLTTCAAFLPIYLAEGGASEFVEPIFMVVTFALMASWAIALTILPALCVPFLKVDVEASQDVYDTPLYDRYRSVLRAALRRRFVTIALAVALLVGAGALFGFVDDEFFAPSDNPMFTAGITLPDSVSEERAAQAVAALHEHIERDLMVTEDRPEGVVSWGTMQGDALPRFVLSYFGPSKATGSIALLVRASSREAVDWLTEDIVRWVEGNLIGARAEAGPLQLGPDSGPPVAIKVAAADEVRLMAAVEALKGKLREIPGARNVRDDWGSPVKKLDVAADPIRLRLAGLTNQHVATSLLTALSGVEISELREGDDRTPIVLRSAGTRDLDLSGLRNLTVFGSSSSTSLQQVADVDMVLDYGRIRRLDRTRTVEIACDVAPGVLARDVQGALLDWADTQDLDAKVTEGGKQAASEDANQSLLSVAPLAALIIAMLLILQFNSFRRMVINLSVLPFAVVGVVPALLLLDAPFGFVALLAMISLFGILLNNGIVLIDRIDTEIAEGRAPPDALVEASVARVRPILLTTITTTAGLIPLYLGGGSTFEGMAVTLIGGLTGGTVLTLVLVPVAYSIAFNVERPS